MSLQGCVYSEEGRAAERVPSSLQKEQGKKYIIKTVVGPGELDFPRFLGNEYAQDLFGSSF